jgi:hypothetical protein
MPGGASWLNGSRRRQARKGSRPSLVAKVHGFYVRFTEAGLPQQDVQEELRDGALVERDQLPFEIGDRADVPVRDDAVSAEGFIDPITQT